MTYISALIYEVPYDVTQDLYIQILEEKKSNQRYVNNNIVKLFRFFIVIINSVTRKIRKDYNHVIKILMHQKQKIKSRSSQ